MNSIGPVEPQVQKTRRRSRFGCRNCKLRKVKCDESQPECKRCRSFGVLCNFNLHIPDLQPVAADAMERLQEVVHGKAELQAPLTSAVWASDASTCYQLDAKSQDFITRYLGRGLITPDDPLMTQVNRELLKLALQYPFLMHASLAVALTYDRHLKSSLGCRRTPEECYHWFQSTALLSKRMTQPIEAKDKDPIWGTTAALAILTFSSPEACTPQESWPLRTCESSGLDWLRMSEGKMSLWHILNPLRPDSIFRPMSATYALMNSPLPEKGIEGIPRSIAAVCHLIDSSTAENNTYFLAAHAVSQIIYLPDSEITTGRVQFFMRSIHGSFKDLLRRRDPVALLLLYLWYRKAGRGIWWIELRARLECPSICSYLQIYHRDNSDVHAFLPGGVFADECY
ncbi:hypothetical protein BKA61DRAFT_595702 [Leptodontidium sp. MPI-SDFR-AT-0119]|nr:hypothetical protein BKA61DRAFT_595702 [Leptodontidium sp. MPI-SDFR-AT-0119]